MMPTNTCMNFSFSPLKIFTSTLSLIIARARVKKMRIRASEFPFYYVWARKRSLVCVMERLQEKPLSYLSWRRLIYGHLHKCIVYNARKEDQIVHNNDNFVCAHIKKRRETHAQKRATAIAPWSVTALGDRKDFCVARKKVHCSLVSRISFSFLP